jgi:hypothetical protein
MSRNWNAAWWSASPLFHQSRLEIVRFCHVLRHPANGDLQRAPKRILAPCAVVSPVARPDLTDSAIMCPRTPAAGRAGSLPPALWRLFLSRTPLLCPSTPPAFPVRRRPVEETGLASTQRERGRGGRFGSGVTLARRGHPPGSRTRFGSKLPNQEDHAV